MGYSQDGKTFWPDDEEATLWLASDQNFGDVIEHVRAKWPNVRIEDLTISSEHIQTSNLSHDPYAEYSPADHTNFIKVTK
jgi:hypothetical protein